VRWLKKKQLSYFAVGFAVLLLVVLLLLAQSSFRGAAGIVLPDEPASAGLEVNSADSQPNVVEITPETVKPAMMALTRPASYARTQIVETFWSGGSGQSVSQVYVSGNRTRIDTRLPDNSIRHTLVAYENGATQAAIGVWYDDDTQWTTLHGGHLAADLAGRMLTYETLRELPVERIAAADYQMYSGVPCIYVETVTSDAGYADRYWVGVDTGLLCAAERVWGGEVVYRFTASQPEPDAPGESLFLLPDGSALGA